MEKLSHQDQQTYDAVFRHPVSGNIERHALLALFNHLGEVIDEPNGKVKITRNGQTMMLRNHSKDADREEIEDIRKFLAASEETEPLGLQTSDYLLVLDHTEAHIYRTEAANATLTHIEPYDPHGWDKHVHDSHVTARHYTTALHHEFYVKIANALEGAGRILVFGSGKGSSQEFDHMLEDLKNHHPDFEKRLIGTLDLDLSHMTEGEMLAKAREIFGTPTALLV